MSKKIIVPKSNYKCNEIVNLTISDLKEYLYIITTYYKHDAISMNILICSTWVARGQPKATCKNRSKE